MWPNHAPNEQNGHIWTPHSNQNPGRFIDSQNQSAHAGGAHGLHKLLIAGGGNRTYIDLSDLTLRAKLDELNPATNYYQSTDPLESSSDRTGVDVFYEQSIIFSIPNGVLGADILGFSALIGALNLTGHPNGIATPSPSFTTQIRFYSDEIDPTTIVWNDRAGLTLLGSAFTFNNDIITSTTESGVDTDIDLTLGGSAGAYIGVFAEPSVSLNASTFRAVEIMLDSPGVTDPTTGEASYAADITNPRIYLGEDA